ncbi:MAG: HAMP domain-containing histidine kinase [Puniceicoccales bacterium]|jgi:signal transduction histidine kinase|nr:HAMP domain-containing histidine kinase [Puniceicoccales bacterium]
MAFLRRSLSGTGLRSARLLFALCCILVFFALGWTSATLLQLESAQEAVRRDNNLDQHLQRTRYVSESWLLRRVDAENNRPYFDYFAFHALERPYDAMFDPPSSGENLRQTSLSKYTSIPARLHFMVAPSGEISSPEVPPEEWCSLAKCTTSHSPFAARLGMLRASSKDSDFHALFLRALVETMRKHVAAGTLSPAQTPETSLTPKQDNTDETGKLRFTGKLSLFFPTWYNGELYLLRCASTTQGDCIQGIWVDWPALKTTLEARVANDLRGTSFRPTTGNDNGLPLVTLPITLMNTGLEEGEPPPTLSRTLVMLITCWAFAALAMLGLGALFFGILSLSERRATFVSAVTHELRTPLTTFQLYTEMLAGGMVSEESRKIYIATLHSEATRLRHLVENVLGYARIEKGRALRRDETLVLGDFLSHIAPRLKERLIEGKMTFSQEISEDMATTTLFTDGTAIDQILFNLADNAAKYAGTGCHATLTASADNAKVYLDFSDNGKGIPLSAQRKLFQAFHRSAEEAAGSKPGVGLGLAFSRQLARWLGGDLKLKGTNKNGCAFRLELPRKL